MLPEVGSAATQHLRPLGAKLFAGVAPRERLIELLAKERSGFRNSRRKVVTLSVEKH